MTASVHCIAACQEAIALKQNMVINQEGKSIVNVTHNRKDNCLCGRKVGEISVVPDPRAACHVRGQYSELVSASGI